MTVRIDGGMREHSLVSGCGILLVEGARRGRAIDPNIGVVDNLRVAGTKFQSFHRPSGSRKRLSISFERTTGNPSFDDVDFGVAERLMPDELAVARLGLPRRHDAALRRRGDLPGVLPGERIRQQTERRGAIRVMACPAFIEKDRCEVFVEGNRCACRLSGAGLQSHCAERHHRCQRQANDTHRYS